MDRAEMLWNRILLECLYEVLATRWGPFETYEFTKLFDRLRCQ